MNETKKPALAVHILWMVSADLLDCVATEVQACLADGWSEEDFLNCLQNRNCIGMVAVGRECDHVVGHLVYELHKTHLTILSLAVHPYFQRRGVGRALIEKLKGKLSTHRRRCLYYGVRDSNLRGQLFLRAMGFMAVEVLREHHDNGDDNYLMRYLMTGAEVPAPENDGGNRVAQYEDGE